MYCNSQSSQLHCPFAVQIGLLLTLAALQGDEKKLGLEVDLKTECVYVGHALVQWFGDKHDCQGKNQGE